MRKELTMREIFIVTFSVIVFVRSATVPDDHYSTRYDYLDMEMILNSKRLVHNYVDCMLGKKPCPPQGKELRRIIPEALETTCTKCTNKQKESALRIIHRLQRDYPNLWDEIREKWDPTGDLVQRLEYSFDSNKTPDQIENTIISSRFGNSFNTRDVPNTNDIDGYDTKIVTNQTPKLTSTSTSTSSISTVKTNTEQTRPSMTPKPASTTQQTKIMKTSTVSTSQKTNRIPIFTSTFTLNTATNKNWFDQIGTRMAQTAGKIANGFIKTIGTVIVNGK